MRYTKICSKYNIPVSGKLWYLMTLWSWRCQVLQLLLYSVAAASTGILLVKLTTETYKKIGHPHTIRKNTVQICHNRKQN
jgi:hypothetical protein